MSVSPKSGAETFLSGIRTWESLKCRSHDLWFARRLEAPVTQRSVGSISKLSSACQELRGQAADSQPDGSTVDCVVVRGRMHRGTYPRYQVCYDGPWETLSKLMIDEGGPLEQPTRPQIWKGESPFSVNCLYQRDSISGACRGNEARSARK